MAIMLTHLDSVVGEIQPGKARKSVEVLNQLDFVVGKIQDSKSFCAKEAQCQLFLQVKRTGEEGRDGH